MTLEIVSRVDSLFLIARLAGGRKPQAGQPLSPVVAIPRTKYLCISKKMTTMGIVIRTEPAMMISGVVAAAAPVQLVAQHLEAERGREEVLVLEVMFRGSVLSKPQTASAPDASLSSGTESVALGEGWPPQDASSPRPLPPRPGWRRPPGSPQEASPRP
jgi:hypothetical protein